MTDESFTKWRLVHRGASGVIGLLGIVHCGLTAYLYDAVTPDAVWFLGTGVALIGIALMNWAHVGLEPCMLPTARAVRWLNWLYVPLAGLAVVAVPQPQAYMLAAALVVQAVAAHTTLRG